MLSNSLYPLADLMDDQLATNMINCDILKRIKEISQLDYEGIVEPIVQIISYFSSYNDQSMLELEKHNFVEIMYYWLKSDKYSTKIKTNLLWALSNFTVSSETHIIQALPSETHYKYIIGLCYDQNPKISKEAIFVICNITNESTFRRKHQMVLDGFFQLCRDKLADTITGKKYSIINFDLGLT